MENRKPDWWKKISGHAKDVLRLFLDAIKPPSRIPIWQWLVAHYELIQGKSNLPGTINFDFFPASKFFFTHAQDYRCRQITEMVCHQSGKTENSMMKLCWSAVERPLPTMWVMANADQCEEFAKDRLYPAIESCPPAFELAPKEREKWTKNLVQFDSMTLYLRGSNSRGKLRSTPIGRIFCDERHDWKPGAIQTLRKRLTTFSNSQEISMGTPGVKDDEFHTDWKDGSQTFMHWHCLNPECRHSQPFRFGRDATVLFPETRAMGGVVWDTNDTTKPEGVWNYDEVRKTVRYECEKCGRRYQNVEKVDLLKTVHEHHRNPKALPRHYSSSRNVLMMPWRACDWAEVAVRFLEAKQAMKTGDLEPMKSVVTEDQGEPWESLSSYKQKGDLLERIGEYKLHELWTDPKDPTKIEPNTTLILTFDRQMTYLRYVIRQWRRNGQSRLIQAGRVGGLDDLRALQIEMRITDRCVWGDDRGSNVAEFRQKALQWSWNIMLGEDDKYFTIFRREKNVDKSYRQGWRETSVDPGIGTTREGRATMKAYLWSNPWFKDKLYFLFVHGTGPLWEIPKNIPTDYLTEMNGNQWREKENSRGEIEGYFHETGADHAADCELMQIVVADIGGITRTLRKPDDQKGTTANAVAETSEMR